MSDEPKLVILSAIWNVLKLVFGIIAVIFKSIYNIPFIQKILKKHRLIEDFHIAPYFFTALFKYFISVKTKKFQYWYIFEEKVSTQPTQLCISYPKPTGAGKNSGKPKFQVEQYTYKETYEIVLRLSYYFVHELHFQPGDTIGVYYTNKPVFIFMWLALWNIGCVPAFLNYNSTGTPLKHSLDIANIKDVLIDEQCSDTFQIDSMDSYILHHVDELKMYKNVLLNTEYQQFRQLNSVRSPTTGKDYNPACLIYTSGTTGLPKSAIMSWRKACIGCSLFGRIYHMEEKNSVIFTAMPLYHSTAALLGVCAVISQGGCVAISNKFSASSFWEQVCLTKATHIQYVGEICRYLLNTMPNDFEKQHQVKIAYGNGLRPDIWVEFKKRFQIPIIGEFYASTEAPFATTSYQEGYDFGVGSCRTYGPLVTWFLNFQQVLIKVDPEDSSQVYRNSKGFCEACKPNENGELLMKIFFPKKPETSFQGYLGNKKATESKVLRNVFKKGDAYYRSGDLLKSDENQLWYFVDRMGDTFRWKSENVSATEVENCLMDSQPADKQYIDECLVCGIKVLNLEGRCGFAVIKFKEPLSKKIPLEMSSPEIFLNALLPSLQKNLPKYALPLFVKFADEIEHTHNHKVKKTAYKDQILPHGENTKETIYFLKNNKKYVELTDQEWEDILSNKTKI